MIRVARERSVGHRNVHFDVIDVGATPPPREHFDVVLCVSTLHHLPFAETVRSLAAAVRPGGRLIVQDLLDRSQWRYAPSTSWRGQREPGSVGARVARSGSRASMRRTVGGERYLTPGEVRPTFDAVLAGVRVRHHLEWRYTAVWERPVVDGLRTRGSGESRSSATPAGRRPRRRGRTRRHRRAFATGRRRLLETEALHSRVPGGACVRRRQPARREHGRAWRP
jgi:SAM-dependent methyltransferase